MHLTDGLAQMYYCSQNPPTKQKGKIDKFLHKESKLDPEKYYFDESAGDGVPVYVVDTGVNTEHPVGYPPWPVPS